MNRAMIAVFAWGAFGGVLPTIAKLASTYASSPETPLPALGLFFGLFLWAVVGGGIALTNTSYETRQAIFAGVAAPALLANLVSGVTNPPAGKLAFLEISAYAQQTNTNDATGGGRAIIVSPSVIGGLPRVTSIPVTAEVRTGDKSEIVPIGEIKNLSSPTAFTLPSNTSQVFVSGTAVKTPNAVTSVDLSVTTEPSSGGDLLWALGAPRKFDIKSLDISPGQQKF